MTLTHDTVRLSWPVSLNIYNDTHHDNDLILYFIYQLPFILTAVLPVPDRRCLSHGMCLYQVMMALHFLSDVAIDAEIDTKIDRYVIFASLKES